IRHAYDDDALAGFENALAVQRIDANALGAEKLGEYDAWGQPHVMPFGEHNLDIRMEFAIRQPRRAMIDAAGQVADFGMQRAAIGDVYLLDAPADAEQRHTARNAGLDQGQRQRIASLIVGLAARVRLLAEQTRMHIGACAGEQDAVDAVEERRDVGNLRRAGEHQRQCAGSLGDRTQVALADALRRELALHEMQAADHADNGFSAGHLGLSPGIPSRNWKYHWRTELRRLALAELIRCLLGLSAFGCGPDTRRYRRDEGGTRGITSTYPRGNANSSPIEKKQHETTTILDAIEGLPRQTHLHRLAFVRNAVVVK